MKMNRILYCFLLAALPAYATMYIPIEKKGWHFGFQTVSVKNYFAVSSASQTINHGETTDIQNFNVEPVRSKLYKAQVAYFFDHNLDVNLNWMHFNATSNQTLVGEGLDGSYTVNQFGTGINHYRDADVSQMNQIQTAVTNKIDVTNLEFGRTMLFSQKVSLRVHTGLQVAYVRQNLMQTASDSTITGEFNDNTMNRTVNFTGIGPRVGFDTNYRIWRGFSFGGAWSGAILTGDLKNNTTGTQSNESNTDVGNTVNATLSQPGTIFDFDAVISLRFIYPTEYGNVGFDTGYQMGNYEVASQAGPFIAFRVSY